MRLRMPSPTSAGFCPNRGVLYSAAGRPCQRQTMEGSILFCAEMGCCLPGARLENGYAWSPSAPASAFGQAAAAEPLSPRGRCLSSPWGNEDTQQLIDILDRYQVKATFFVVGDWVDKYPESVKALHDAGHEVMNHSNTHAHYPQLSVEEIVADLNACNDKIEAITGVRPTLVRLPYGDYDDNAVRAVRSTGMEPIQWDVDSLDWKEIPAEEIVQRVTGKVQPGSIVLFHNAALHTPEALPSILETLIQEGYTLVPISQLILGGEYNTDYTIDHTGRQCPA